MNLFSEGTKKGIGKAITALKQSQCVFFDVDSTIIRQEGLDEFEKYGGLIAGELKGKMQLFGNSEQLQMMKNHNTSIKNIHSTVMKKVRIF